MPGRTVASLIGLGLLLAGTAAPAQETGTYAPEPARVLHFTKPPNSPAIPRLDSVNQKGRTVVPTREADRDIGRRPPLYPARTDPALRPTAFQVQPREPAVRAAEEPQEYQVQLEPPGPLRLFRLESERALQERIRQEVRDRTPPGATPERTFFPEEPVITHQPYPGRSFPPGNRAVEPCYLCYGRLLFEQKNFERYGWDLGPLSPFLSAAGFYWDVATLPYHLFTAPCRPYECSAGYCLPGSPVPLLLYPPELSLTGFLAEAGTITALFLIFP